MWPFSTIARITRERDEARRYAKKWRNDGLDWKDQARAAEHALKIGHEARSERTAKGNRTRVAKRKAMSVSEHVAGYAEITAKLREDLKRSVDAESAKPTLIGMHGMEYGDAS